MTTKSALTSVQPVPSESAALSLNEIYPVLLNSMSVGVLAVDSSGMILTVNRVVNENFSISSGSHLKDALPDLWHKVAKRLGGRNISLEITVHGKEKNYLVQVSPMLMGTEQIGAVCVFVESTELEDMAVEMQSFQELSRELDTIIDSSSDSIWICDGDANVLRVNPASARINRVNPEEIIGRNMRDLVSEGLFDKSITLEVIKTRQRVNIFQQQRDGRKLMVTATPVFDPEGKLIRVIICDLDITEIDTLQRELEAQEAIKGQLLSHMLVREQIELESRRIIAHSPHMLEALHQSIKVSACDSTVLILGESGVGKGVLANLIHSYSLRAPKQLIQINCGAIPESLIESELFGYEKGAFTGAKSAGKPGYFEIADGGTLFLDEIAELPLPSQVKLLRFLEDGRITRLGGTSGRTVDVRILAATHCNLQEMVALGRFRLDLYYRLKVIPIYVPAVRERKECILPLIKHYMNLFGEKRKVKKRLTRAASDALLSYPYPGNVRELINICERLVVMSETEVIDLKDLPPDIVGPPVAEPAPQAGAECPEELTLQQAMDNVERQILARSLEQHGNQSRMAEVLGVNQSTIARKLKKYGLWETTG